VAIAPATVQERVSRPTTPAVTRLALPTVRGGFVFGLHLPDVTDSFVFGLRLPDVAGSVAFRARTAAQAIESPVTDRRRLELLAGLALLMLVTASGCFIAVAAQSRRDGLAR
jgi:hypothetical protein